MGFGFGRLSASPFAPPSTSLSGLSADDFAAILAAAQPGAPSAPPRQPFGFGPMSAPTGAPMAMPTAPGGNLSTVASLFGGQSDPRADTPDQGAAPIAGRSPLDFGPPGGATFDDRFNQAPVGQGFGVDPKAVAAMRSGLLRQAPGGIVPLPSETPDADVPATGAVPTGGRAPDDIAAGTPRPFGFGQPPVAAPTPPPAPAMQPAASLAPTSDDGGFLSRLGDPRISNLLLGIGQGLLTTKGFGPALAAGTSYAARMGKEQAAADLAQAELGLKVRKVTQEQQGNNITLQRLIEKGVPAADAQAALGAAMAGHAEALSNLLNNSFRKTPDAPAGFERNPDGSMRWIAGGPQDPSVKFEEAKATAGGAGAGKPEEPFNLSPGQTRYDASGNPIVAAPDRSKMLEHTSSIRKEIHTLPSYKNYSQALPVYQGMLETAYRDSKASDLNLIYGLGKIMDPGSVVREGELHLAQDTQGVADRLIGMYNGVMGGARLSPQSRQQLLSEAFGRIQSYESAFGQDRRGYEGIVARQGMNADDVLPNFAPVKPYQPARKAQAGPAAPDGAVRALQADPNLRDQFEAKYGRGSADRYLGGR